MDRKILRNGVFIVVLISSFFIFGCAGMEFAPREGSLLWYYPKELPEAHRAVEAAREAGRDKECPEEFEAVEKLKEDAYQKYWDCFDDEAIAMAKEATEKAKALCPVKPVPAPEPVPRPEPRPEPMPQPKEIMLEDINFEFDKATLTSTATMILERNIEILKENPQARIQIEGHACAHGTEDYNMALSERRAQASKEYLINNGISSDRISTISYGETRLALPEIPTPENKESREARANRRVHFEVISQ